MSAFTMQLDLSDLGLDALATGAEEAARPAAQAAAQVYYNRVKANVAKIGRVTGSLAGSIYQVYSRDNSGRGVAQYHVSWNHKKAPHGHLVEYGHLQRYVTYLDKRGQWRTLVRPEMRGKPAPKRRAPQAVKDSYYVPLKGGPRVVGARSFVRAAATPDVRQMARRAAIDAYFDALRQKGLL